MKFLLNYFKFFVQVDGDVTSSVGGIERSRVVDGRLRRFRDVRELPRRSRVVNDALEQGLPAAHADRVPRRHDQLRRR